MRATDFIITKDRITSDRIISILNEEIIQENAPRTLYHGTLKTYLPGIKKYGLLPKLGDFTRHFYDDDPDLEELVFAASRKDVRKALNSIIFNLKKNNIDPSPENIIKYGAIVVIKDVFDNFEHRPYDYYNDWNEYPRHVEPGDFYSREPVEITYILQNKKLKDFLRRQGFDDWLGTKHPKLVKKNEIAEAKNDYPLRDRTNP
jgi:hypothetical protein